MDTQNSGKTPNLTAEEKHDVTKNQPPRAAVLHEIIRLQGDIIELGITATEFGRTSITLTCEVRNKITRKSILTVDKMVFVNLGEDGLPAPHGRTEIKYVKDQFQDDSQA